MLINLRTRLSISYVVLVLMCVFLITFLSNFFLERQFRDYVMSKHEQQNQEIASVIGGYYLGDQGWDTAAIKRTGLNVLHEGRIVKVLAYDNTVIWDATVHNLGMCVQMLDTIEQNMLSRYPNWQGEYTEETYPIIYDSGQVGYLVIGYHGPFFYSDHDLDFITTLNRLLLGTALLLSVLALGLGYVMSRRISRPISKVVGLSEKIARGNYGQTIENKESTKELVQLTNSINQLAKSLDEQENRKKQLTADIAHELRTPLTTLQSHIEAMIDGVWKPDSERLKSLHQEITRITRLVSDLETLSNLENNATELMLEQFDLTEHIRTLINTWDIIKASDLKRITVDGKGLQVTADKDKISQIMCNLLMNAVSYADEGQIEAKIQAEDNYAVIEVHDKGSGIKEEDLPYIFERFYRADKSRARRTGGSGLGLAITKALVVAHGGTINVESRTGQGTVFTVKLPINPG